MEKQTTGMKIADERKKLGLSQEALGDRMEVSRQAISKWESDAAMPEIEKLTKLSRLFGVSVGWLLGLEESPKAETVPNEKKETLSETELLMVEEVVKRYLPRRNGRRLAAAICGALLVGAFLLTGMLLADNREIRRNVEILREEVANLRETKTENPEFGLVEQAVFTVADVERNKENQPMAQVQFVALPKLWQEGDTAFLTVRSPDGTAVRADCAKVESFLGAKLRLPTENGYDLCLTICRGDGVQEQQTLVDDAVENLKTALSITADMTYRQMQYYNDTLTFGSCYLSVRMPDVGFERFGWERADLVLMALDAENGAQGREIGRVSLLEDSEKTELRQSVCKAFSKLSFENVKIYAGEQMELFVEAELDCGIRGRICVGYFTADKTFPTR